VKLTSDQIAVVLYALRDLIARRNLGRRPIPPEVVSLNGALLQAMSAGGHESEGDAEEFESNTLIGPAGAAALIGCTPRHVRRIHADLEGVLVEGRWVFRRQTVVEYAQAKGMGSDGNRILDVGCGAVPPRAA
jgi:hypothetical protein